MLRKSLNGMLKAGALFATLFVAATGLTAAEAPKTEGLTTAVGDQSEAAVRRNYVRNTVNGFAKGLEIRGKTLTAEQREKLHRVADEAFPKVIALVRKAGLYEEYRKMHFDRELRELDQQVFKAKTMQEVMALAQKEIALLHERYPKLMEWISTDPEMQALSMQIMQKMMEACK